MSKRFALLMAGCLAVAGLIVYPLALLEDVCAEPREPRPEGLECKQIELCNLMVPRWGDIDQDMDCDMQDFMAFVACYNGPNRPTTVYACWCGPCCLCDMDYDCDVDLEDFTRFQACFAGPNFVPACDYGNWDRRPCVGCPLTPESGRAWPAGW